MPGQCLSNKYLWKCGVQKNLNRTKQGALYLNDGRKEGLFISRVYDSGQREMEWGMFVLEADRGIPVKVHVWLFDEMWEDSFVRKKAEGKSVTGDRDSQSVKGGTGSQSMKGRTERWFDMIKERAQYHSNYREMLLHGQGCGRYARIAVEIFPGEGGGQALFRGYRMTFPKESFTEYLPSIYRDNIQLERFLEVQQNIYLGLEERIDSLGKNLDYEFCNAMQLLQLAKWMGWGGLGELIRPAGQMGKLSQEDEDLLRRLLAKGIFMGGRKGTCTYYTELAAILTGRETVMIEEKAEGKATVLVLGHLEKGREKFLGWLRKNVPIGVNMDFVVLHRTDRLDGQFFLDETAYLCKYESELVRGGVPIERLRLM